MTRVGTIEIIDVEGEARRAIMSGLAYYATPYSRYKGGNTNQAFADACVLAAKLIVAGLKIYSPIAHGHCIALAGGLDLLDHKLWLPFDEAMMDKADVLLVAEMEGWHESFGIAHEIKFFERADKPVLYLDPRSLTIRPTSSAQILKFPGEVRAL